MSPKRERAAKGETGGGGIRTRKTSPVTDALAIVAVLATAPWAAIAIAERGGIAPALPGTVAGALPAMPLASVALCLFAVVSEAVSRLRKPPARWRIVEELKRAIIQVKLLKDNRQQFSECFKAGKFAHYDRRAKMLRLWFDLRVPDEKGKLARCASPAAFRHAQDVSIEPHIDMKGRRKGYDLLIWYGTDGETYRRSLDKIKPW